LEEAALARAAFFVSFSREAEITADCSPAMPLASR